MHGIGATTALDHGLWLDPVGLQGLSSSVSTKNTPTLGLLQIGYRRTWNRLSLPIIYRTAAATTAATR